MLRRRTLTVLWVLGWGGVTLLTTPVLAQPIVVDTQVEGPQPVVGVNNGVPVVDIAPPGAGGVSNNAFTHFNVGPQGVVLNNSASDSATQLAGQINGNPRLGTGPAATILNQVTAPNPSQLLGTLEVAGQRANVIVANPAGITCNGCGFLNAPRATLTTGRPQVGLDGRIGFDVASGAILIDGAGLNAGVDHRASLSQVDLLARAIKINASLWADRLNIVIGNNHVDYGSEEVKAKSGSSYTPFALDTAALGGMYANSIRLIGTEAGVGVNLGGDLVALTGELKINTAGQVQIGSSATLKARGDLEIDAGSNLYNAGIHNAGQLLAGVDDETQGPIEGQGSIKLRAGEKNGGKGETSIVNTGALAGGKDIRIEAARVELGGGRVCAPGTLAINNGLTGSIKISGARISAGTMELGTLHNAGGELTAVGDVTITSLLANKGGKIVAGGDLTIKSQAQLNNAQGRLEADGTILVHAEHGKFDNQQGVIRGKTIIASTRQSNPDGHLYNMQGLIWADEALTIRSAGVDNRYTQSSNGSPPLGLAGQTITLSVAEKPDYVNANPPLPSYRFNNIGGTVAAGQTLTLQTPQLINGGTVLSAEEPGKIFAGDRLSITTHALEGGGTLRSEGDLSLTIQTPKSKSRHSSQSPGPINVSKIFAGRDLTLDAWALQNTAQGELVGRGVTRLNITRSLHNQGKLEGGSLRINAAEANLLGQIQADQDLHLSVAGPVFLGGQLGAGNALSVSATTLTNDGMVEAGHELSLTADGALTIEKRGRLLAGVGQTGADDGSGEETPIPVAGQGSIRLKAPVIKTLGPSHWEHSASAGKSITLMADQLELAGAPLSTPGKLALHATGDLDLGQQALQRALQGRSLEIQATNLYNRDGELAVKGDFAATLSGVFDNTSGTLAAGERLTILYSALSSTMDSAPLLDNRHGQIAAPRVLIKMPQVDNPGGQILGDQVSIEALRLTNRAGSPGGVIAARAALHLGVQALDNGAHALLYSQGDLSVGGALDENAHAVNLADTVANTGGVIDAQGHVVMQARTISNREGATVLAGHTVLWPTEALDNDASSQVITGDFLLETDRFTNRGRLEGRTIEMTVNHFDNVGKLVRADERLALRGKGPESLLDNRQGLLMSAGSLALQFDRLDNTQGTVLVGQEGQAQIGQIRGSGRWLAGGRLDVQSPSPWEHEADDLMDAAHLSLRVAKLSNRGRLYGDAVSIEAPEIHNEGGVIAARHRLDIGVGRLENQAQGWIASADRLVLGGSLDGEGRAVGQADRVRNRGATLESLGDFTLAAAQFSNENARLETAHVTLAGPANHFSIQPKGEEERIDSSRLIEITVKNRDRYAIYPPATAPPPFSYAQLRSWVEQTVGLDRRVNKNDQEIDQALQAIREETQHGLVPLAHLKRLAQAFKQLARYPELEDTVQELAGKGNHSQDTLWVKQLWVEHRPYAPLIDLAQHHTVWKRAVQSSLFKAETGGPIELLKAWRVLENRPVIDNDPRLGLFWGHASTGKPPVFALLPRLTQLGHLSAEQAREAQPYYVSQVLATPRWAREWREFETQRTVTQTQVTHSEPGQVLAGGQLILAIGQQGLNSNSHILAGGKLAYTGQDLTLESAKSERLLHETGRTRQAYIRGGGDGPLKRTSPQRYEPDPVVLESTPIAQVVEQTQVLHSPGTIVARRLQAPWPEEAKVNTAHSSSSWRQVDGAQVRQLDRIAVPYTVLYRAAPAEAASLYETGSAFLNGQTQPGLGTLLQALEKESSVRPLGDGFMESRLVRDQVMALTGQRFLPGFDNDQRAYRALLSQTAVLASGSANPGDWPVGEPLSETVIQALPHSVVWPVRQEVIGPDGKTVQALMPRLYLRESVPSLLQATSQVSAPDILLQLLGKLDQDGRVQAQRSLNLESQDLTLRGDVTGQTVSTHTQGDTQILGGQLTGEKTLGVTAEGRVTIASTVHHTANRTQLERVATLTTTEAGAPITIRSQGDTTLNAAKLQSAGDIDLQSQGNVKLTAQTERWQETITFGRKNQWSQTRQQDWGSALQAQGSMQLYAGGDMVGTAVNLSTQKDLLLRAKGAMTFEPGHTHTLFDDEWYSRDKGFLSSSTEHFKRHQEETRSQSNTFTGKTVQWEAERIEASDLQIEAEELIRLYGREGLAFKSGEESIFYEEKTQREKKGFGHSGLLYGQSERGAWQRFKGQTQTPNTLISQGNIALRSEGPMVLRYTDLLAEENLTVHGASIAVTAGTQQIETDHRAWQHRSGFYIGAQGLGSAGALKQGLQTFNAAKQDVDSKTQSLYRLAAARAFYDTSQQIKDTGVRLALGWGEQSRLEQAKTEQTQSLGSRIEAGRALSLQASEGDIELAHTHLRAKQLGLTALYGAIEIKAVQNTQTSSYRQVSEETGVEIGGSANRQGLGLDIGMQQREGLGQGKQEEIAWQASTVKGEAVAVRTQDLTLLGSTIKAEQLTLDIARNLRMISLMDDWRQVQKAQRRQLQTQIGLSGPLASTLSFSELEQDGRAEFKGVNTQAGLKVGSGGLEMKVGGHTALVGAKIEAEATASNRLVTRTLSALDLAGAYELDAHTQQRGVTLGTAGSLPGEASLPLHAGLLFTPDQTQKERQTWRTASLIESTIAVEIEDTLGQEKQTGKTVEQTLVSLNRDPVQTGQRRSTLDKLRLDETLNAQKGRLEAWGQGSQAVARTVGDLAQAQYEGARDERTRALWAEGGGARILTHAVAGGLLGELGSANVAGAVAGAVVSQLLVQPLAALGKTVTDNELATQLLTNLASSAIGYMAGGQVGMASASQLDLYNRQLHPQIRQFITDKELIQRYAEQRGISPHQATTELAKAAITLNDELGQKVHGPEVKPEAIDFLRTEGQAKRLPDESLFFEPSVEDFKNPKKYINEALTGDGKTFYEKHLGGEEDLGQEVLGKLLKGVGQGTGQFALDAVKVGLERPGLLDIPHAIKQFSQGLKEVAQDPQGQKEAVLNTLQKMPGELKQWGKAQSDLLWLYTLYGEYDQTAKMITPPALEIASIAMPIGVGIKAAKGTQYAAKTESLAVKEGTKSLPTVIEPKVSQQMTQRGWSEETINGVIAYPTKTLVTKDTRWDPLSGIRLNEPATSYIARDGAYVIRNDRTGVIVEISDRNSINGVAFWRQGKDGIATFESVGIKGVEKSLPLRQPQTDELKVLEDISLNRMAADATINFGKVENQISHTFRHIDAAGIDRKLVQEAIQKDLSKFASSMPDGLYSSSVNVNGVKIDYNAFKLPDGSINVGRVTPPRNQL